MSRLADYFVVVGYDYSKGRSGSGSGIIINRFPEKDWVDCPFTQGIELFCQPSGWQLWSTRQAPTFFISVLTDIDADRHYCACLTFTEDVVDSGPSGGDEEEDEVDPALVRHSKMFAPKTLVLVSRLDYFETFRNCLGLIFTVHIENQQVQIETLIGNILGCVQVPPPGGPQIRFSIGAGDRQALQPPLSPTLAVTRTAVAMLFQQLGISNVLSVFCAALTDHKILFHSMSYWRLADASHALSSLMYPLKYSYVYIPLLPAGLYEVVNTPTPFIAGVHSSLKSQFCDLLDVIIVDLDGGSIHVPEHVTLSLVPEPVLTRTVQSLNIILNPELLQADMAFAPTLNKSTPLEMLDKEIRAVFLRMFSELFLGYRNCLTIIRIHPEPVITFHKANFLGHRGMVEDDFMSKVLYSMSYNTFVHERGPPFRVTDLFDEVFASMQETLKSEVENPERMQQNIKELAQTFYQHENPNPQPYMQKIPKPSEGAFYRIHQPPFPKLEPSKVQEIIDEGLEKNSLKAKLSQVRQQLPRIVPIGSHITSVERHLNNNARRLEVLKNCVNFVFDNKISDARKIFPAVLRALKSKFSRLALVKELSNHVAGSRAMLEHQQFDMVVRLLNCALQNDSSMDENGVAAAILPLATSFYRKLCTGVIQFAYTVLQEHAVWANHQFWEATFYLDVEAQIRQLYLPHYEDQGGALDSSKSSSSLSPASPREPKDGNNWRSGLTPDAKRRSAYSHSFKPREISALEIAAEQMRVWPNLSPDEQADLINNEESIVYSQAIHYANRMVYLRVPLDASKSPKEVVTNMEGDSASSNVTNSLAESDSLDAESGFDEQEITEVNANVTKFVTRFVDKVCTESGVTSDHIKQLHQMVPGVVAMHIETLEGVCRESKRLPPIQKPKILTPTLLPGEEIIMEGLRVYILPDGREEGTGVTMGGPALLPVEGAIFLTSYRILFKGTPCDPLACEQVVCRSFPVSTLTREKKISVQYLPHLDQWLQEGVQLRSNTFQLMKIAFDEEVSSENIETFRKLVHKVRNPVSVFDTFAFTGHMFIQPTPLLKNKEKNASLNRSLSSGSFGTRDRTATVTFKLPGGGRMDKKSATLNPAMLQNVHPMMGFAKRTLMKTARKAGLKPKESKRQKFILPTPPLNRRVGTPDDKDRPSSLNLDEELSVIDEREFTEAIQNDSRNIDRLAERPYCRDYSRLGLGTLYGSQTRTRTDAFRLTMINTGYNTCRSYPAVLVVPQMIMDDSIRKFARGYRQYRFPVVTWRHPKTKAILLRASGFHGKSVMGMLKGHNPQGSAGSETSISLEQEKYFSALVNITPLALGRFGSWRTDKLRTSTGSLQYSAKQNGNIEYSDMAENLPQSFHKAVLYVLGEKTQMKGIKMESYPKCDFIPVDYVEVRNLKSSFKKLMRACVPSSPSSEGDKGFLRAVEESEWLPQLQNILQIAGAIVDLMDVQGSSVMVCLEDGWDFTTQVLSVTQILMDPYYRTVEGFRTLVDKEWLAFGHRFTHRSNQTAANQASGFAPVFLQFLDVVHQIHSQFPLSFEYNQYFLKFLAYHYVSNRFRSFMLDNECERVEAGWLLDDRSRGEPAPSPENAPHIPPRRKTSQGLNIWDYIDQHQRRNPVFLNFRYSPVDAETVLRPHSNIANLKIWDYYLEEDLHHGPAYDFEVVAQEMREEEEQELIDGPMSKPASLRRFVNACYDDVERIQPGAFSHILKEISRLENEIGHHPTRWRNLWERLEKPSREALTRKVSFNMQIVRSHGRAVHKRSTIEILVKGKMIGEAAKMLLQPHRFDKFTYTTPAYCDYCSHVLWGLMKTGMRCSDCGYNCHEKCMSHVPKNCPKFRPVSEISNSNTSISKASVVDSVSLSGEHRTYAGYLFKRGALLKGWKQRFFVLDSMKHELRYYDSQEDSHCKGYIDLAEVQSVTPLKNVQGAPKKADDNAFFELKTSRRQYNFLAPDGAAAQDWSDKIQSCIQ